MATLAEIRQQYPQYADMSDADLANAMHRKFYSDMPREEFDKRMGIGKTETDPYRIAARKEVDDLKAKGVDTGAGIVRQAMQGATFNLADEVMAGVLTPLEMIRQGTFNPAEGYRHAKAREDIILEDARKDNGLTGAAAELGGGLLTGASVPGLASRLAPTAGMLSRSGANAVDGAVMGGLAGAADGNSLGERLGDAALGAAVGGAVGAVAPPALAVLRSVASPILSNIAARANPQRFAENQVARAVTESGMTPAGIAGDVASAAREGQGMFTVADAMGSPGQRMLSSTARAPGPGRTDVVEFLDRRQADQGRRVANTLAEGFDSPQTAAQLRTRLTTERDDLADQAFGAIRADADPVDLSGTIARIDQTLRPGVMPLVRPSNIADDSVESVLQRTRDRLTDGRSVLSDFEAIQRARGDLADTITKAHRAGEGNKVRLLTQIRNELDQALENASQGFRQANADFRVRSQAIDAIDTGHDAALRGRVEDTVPAFNAMRPDQRAAFRTGYADPLIESAQGSAYGVNKARPLTSDAFQAEGAAMAPANDLMQRRIARENTMFQTRNTATGNSKTAENLADDAAMGIDPGILGQILSGNVGGAVRGILAAGQNVLSGNTPEVRQQVANILLQRGQNIPPQMLQQMLDAAVDRIEQVRRIAGLFGRAGQGGVAVGTQQIKRVAEAR